MDNTALLDFDLREWVSRFFTCGHSLSVSIAGPPSKLQPRIKAYKG